MTHPVKQIPGHVLGQVTRTDFVRFAGAGGDFNPMHHDDEFAKASGFPSVFAMGMFTASLASNYITGLYGLDSVRRYKVKFLAPVWPNETLSVQGETAEETCREDGTTTLRVGFRVVNAEGEAKLSGEALVVSC